MSDTRPDISVFLIVAYVPGWLPGAGFQNTAVAWKKQAMGFEQDTYNYVVKSMVCTAYQSTTYPDRPVNLKADGTAESSVVSKAIESEDLSEKSIIPKVGLQMVTGGADTVRNAYSSLPAALNKYRTDCCRDGNLYPGHAPSPRGSEEGTS